MKYNYHHRKDSNEMALTAVFHSISLIEKISLVLFTVLVVSVIFISIWSSILLATGNTQGGGPLGMIAGVIIGFFK